jgi:hypothetical protein
MSPPENDNTSCFEASAIFTMAQNGLSEKKDISETRHVEKQYY